MAALPDWNLPASVWSLIGRAAELARRMPATLLVEVRDRANVLGLATTHDVDTQNRLTRKKLLVALREMHDEQREQLERLELLRTEMREELQSLAAAVGDQLFALERPAPRSRRALTEFDDDFDDLDDDLDIVSYDALLAADGDIDLSD